jgi:CubicO group peptidase (beta-lactamase class C family)
MNPRLSQRVGDFIREKEQEGGIPDSAGIAVSVVTNAKVLFRGTYGLRDRARGLPVTSETIFETSSLTKAFTAAALLMESEAGRVSLTQPLNTPRLLLPLSDKAASQDVSILDVLCHRTGLPSNDLLWYFGGVRGDDQPGSIARLSLLPGGFRHRFTYNNLAYGALGALFEALVGTPWHTYVTKELLAPIGMRLTSVGSRVNDGNAAQPYVGREQVAPVDVSAIAAAGSMGSCLDDMSRWAAFCLNGGVTSDGRRLLSDASIASMRHRHISAAEVNPLLRQGLEWLGSDLDYGLGWFIGTVGELDAMFHPGFIDGFSAAIVLIPERTLGFVVLSNLNMSPVPGQLIGMLAEQMLSPTHQTGEASRDNEPDSVLAAGAAGDYHHAAFGTISVVTSHGRTALEYNGRRWPLRWTGETTAECTLSAFGLQIPLPVQFEIVDGAVRRVSIPLSLDPRVGPQVFGRTSL